MRRGVVHRVESAEERRRQVVESNRSNLAVGGHRWSNGGAAPRNGADRTSREREESQDGFDRDPGEPHRPRGRDSNGDHEDRARADRASDRRETDRLDSNDLRGFKARRER